MIVHVPGCIQDFTPHIWDPVRCGDGTCQLTPEQLEERFRSLGPVTSVTIGRVKVDLKVAEEGEGERSGG